MASSFGLVTGLSALTLGFVSPSSLPSTFSSLPSVLLPSPLAFALCPKVFPLVLPLPLALPPPSIIFPSLVLPPAAVGGCPSLVRVGHSCLRWCLLAHSQQRSCLSVMFCQSCWNLHALPALQPPSWLQYLHGASFGLWVYCCCNALTWGLLSLVPRSACVAVLVTMCSASAKRRS